jgi:hypothetical protein
MRIYLSTFISLAIFLGSFNLAHAAPNFPYGGVAVMHQNCTETDYPSASNTDVARGTALNNAVLALANGDVMYLTAGTFDIGTNTIDLSFGATGTANIHGAGKLLTIIKSSVVGTIVIPGRTTQVTDLSIVGTLLTGDFQIPFGILETTTNMVLAWVKNVYMSAQTDGIYMSPSNIITSTLNVINVTAVSNWDTILFFPTTDDVTVNIYDSSFTSTAISSLQDQQWAHALYQGGGKTNSWNSNFTALEANTEDFATYLTSGTLKFYGGTLHSYSTQDQYYYDIMSPAGGYVGVDTNVTYNHSLTVGTIHSISTVAEVVPSLPAETCQNPLTTNATVTSTAYTVDSTLNTITSIPFATDAATTLTNNLTPATGATFAVFLSDGITQRTGSVVTGDKVIVTAQDTITKKTYTVTVNKTIGGTLSGLGSSLSVVLQNNLGDNLMLSTSTSFTFATSLISGSPYSVTVLTQPTGQTCFVTNGSGTVSTANITNVSVSCTTNTYTLSYFAGTQGSLTGTTSQTVNYNASGSAVTAVPAAGYHFASWSDNSTQNPRTDTNITTDISVIANFATNTTTPPPTLPTVSYSSSGGFVSPAVLATLLAPGASTTAYLNSLKKTVLGCPVGFTCSLNPSYISPTIAITSTMFARSLTLGSQGNDVKSLQIYLNTHGFTVSNAGPGSLGHETVFFGLLTRAALIKFQKAHGITPYIGYFGPITRAYVNGR